MDQQSNINSQTTKKQFKSFWPVVIIIILSAIVGGTAVYGFFKQGLDEQINSLNPGSDYSKTHKSGGPQY